MNEAYQTVITASDEERRDLFLGTAARLGTAVQNVEKDFWVCWTLDALFNGLEPGGPRLLFKGGTSLSKAFSLISRFSEDIDITVFREDLHQAVDVAELEAMSGKKRRARLDEIRDACRTYIDGPFFSQLQASTATCHGVPSAGSTVQVLGWMCTALRAAVEMGRFLCSRDACSPPWRSWRPASCAVTRMPLRPSSGPPGRTHRPPRATPAQRPWRDSASSGARRTARASRP